MKKIISILLVVLMVLSFAMCSYASAIDISTVNTVTNAVRITGNVKRANSTIIHNNYVSDSSFDLGVGDWKPYYTGVAAAPVLESITEEDGNKCLKLSGRNNFTCGFQINIADYLNEHGFGTYNISFRLRADDNQYVTSCPYTAVVMPKKGSGTNAKKYANYGSYVTKNWTTYKFSFGINSFGTDGDGNPLQVCPKGAYAASGSDGTLYIVGNSKQFDTGDTANPKTFDLRDYYLDDFSIQYIENVAETNGDKQLKCDFTLNNGTNQILNKSFMCDADGNYDFFAPIDALDDYTNLSANLKCADTKTDENIAVTVKNSEPDISLAYEGTSLRVGVNPYDYLKTNGLTNATFVAGLYSSTGNMLDAKLTKVTLANSNDLVKIYLDAPSDNSGTVKLFALEDLGTLKPLTTKCIKDIEKGSHRVFVIGDSIAYTYDDDQWPKQGWSCPLPSFFDDNLTFYDCSGGGLSTKSYISPIFGTTVETRNTWKSQNDPLGTWDKIKDQLNPGDFVIMGLGVNDTSGGNDNPLSKGTSEEVYAESIKKFAQGSWEKGADIVFVTMTIHGGGANQTNLENDNTVLYRNRAKVMMKAADEIGATYVDLGKYQLNYYENRAKNYGGDAAAYNKVRTEFHNGADYLHYNINGANMLAKFIAYLIKNSDSDMAKYVKEFDVNTFDDVYDLYDPTK